MDVYKKGRVCPLLPVDSKNKLKLAVHPSCSPNKYPVCPKLMGHLSSGDCLLFTMMLWTVESKARDGGGSPPHQAPRIRQGAKGSKSPPDVHMKKQIEGVCPPPGNLTMAQMGRVPLSTWTEGRRAQEANAHGTQPPSAWLLPL